MTQYRIAPRKKLFGMLGLRKSKRWPMLAPTLLDVVSDEVDTDSDYKATENGRS